MENIRKRIQTIWNLPRRSAGFSLIDLMLAVLIINLSLLFVLENQRVALYASQKAYFLLLASIKSSEWIERFKSCERELLCIQQELLLWKKHIKEIFPQGEGIISSKGLDQQVEISYFYHAQRTATHLLFRP